MSVADENTSNETGRPVDTALVGFIAVAKEDLQEVESSEKSPPVSGDGDKNDMTEQNELVNASTVNEIVLQIVPGTENDVQVDGLQALTSIDQELLRQFATSVANELAQTQP